MCQQYPNAYRQTSVPVRVVYLARQGLWLSLTGFFLFIFTFCKIRAI